MVMTNYQIVCKNLSSDGGRIEKVGLVEEGRPTDPAQEVVEASRVNKLINDGHACFFVDQSGQRVRVHDYDGKFIRTAPDDTKGNNLRHLRDCRAAGH